LAGKSLAEIVRRIEALLFAASRPVQLKELMSICRLRKRDKIISAISELKKKYNVEDSAIELVELQGDRVFLRLKKEYHELVKRYVRKPLFSRGVMKTLSFIAYYQPVEQSKVAIARGGSAYRHIKLLIEKGFVEAEKKGKTKILRTTELLADFLGVPNNPVMIRRALESRLLQQQAREHAKTTKREDATETKQNL